MTVAVDLGRQDLVQKSLVVARQSAKHAAVRCLDEPIGIDGAVHGQCADETDVWAFRRLDWADAAVVRVVHVSDFEAGALPRKATWAKSGKPSLVGELRERVGLVHELGELGAAKELADGRHNRPDVHQVAGRGELGVGYGHALPNSALEPEKANAELVLDEVARRAPPA